MAWYRSIAIDTADIVEPELIAEFNYEVQQKEAVTQTFTVVNPGLYFIAANGVAVGVSGNYPFNFSITSDNQPQYQGYVSNNNYGKYAVINLNAGDVVTYTAAASSRTDYSKKQTFQAVRITNANFVRVFYTNNNPGATVRYSPPADDNMHFIYTSANTIYWAPSSSCLDSSVIPAQCDFVRSGTGTETSIITYSIGCIGDEVYIDMYGSYGSSNFVIDFILQPMSKITGTLTAGQSTITLYDQRIRSSSNVSVLTSNGAWYRDIDVTDGSCTIEFPIQDTDISVEIEVS